MNTGDAHRDAPAAEMMQGYSRAAVDDFLAAAAAERSRLEIEIADARGRLGRAHVALGMHQTMLAMLTDTGRELEDLRRRTERQAAEAIANDEIRNRPSMPAPPFAFDLTAAERAEHAASVVETPSTTEGSPYGEHASGGDDDAYFGFLRGALADDKPLGPRPE